jgi:hypothetical protein
MDLPRLEGDIVLDGRPDEAAWQAVSPLPLTMYTPLFRGEQTEASEIRIGYDRDHLYASGRLFDKEPSEIRINSLHRDRWSGDDFFVLLVDSFNDNQSVRRFGINPAGTRIDELIGADGSDRNLSWDALWDVVTARDERGWYFEMRIPFASLRFPGSGEQVVMGITASRLIARKNERTTWPAINPEVAFDRPSATQDVVLRDIRSSRPVLVTPYALGGMSRLPTAGPQVGPTDGIGEAGVDVKYSLSDNLFLDLSANTDFAQVEADDQQINLTRFPLFFPEKRQFFQERSDLFLYDLGSGGRLFHSRRIGLSDDARPVRILGGARLAGTTGPWSFGVLNMQSDEDRGRAGENFGVARVRRRLFNASSYLGGMVTTRMGTDGNESIAAGLDASLQLPNNHYATARFAATDRNDPSGSFSLADNGQLYLSWERRNARGFSYHVKLNRIGESYTPDVGFLPRRDATFGSLYAVHNVSGERGDRLQSYGPGIVAFAWRSNATKELENYYVAHWWNYELWNGAAGFLQVTTRLDHLPSALPIGDVTVPAGDHKTTNLWFFYQSGPGSRLRTTVSARAGGLYDGRHVELFVRPVWNLSRHFELGADLENTFIRFPERDAAVDVQVARLRLRAAANARLSAAALVQYNSLAHLMGVNVRLRYNVREGTDVWLVYDEGLNTERSIDGTPDALPLSASRSVRAKVTYTFGL